MQPNTGKQTRGFIEDRKNLNLKLQMTHFGNRKSRGDVMKAAFLFLRKKYRHGLQDYLKCLIYSTS